MELRFTRSVRLSPAGEVALEDYARVLTRARHAEAVPDAQRPEAIAGVHLCAPEDAADKAKQDIEGFAREMEPPAEGGGLGWN